MSHTRLDTLILLSEFLFVFISLNTFNSQWRAFSLRLSSAMPLPHLEHITFISSLDGIKFKFCLMQSTDFRSGPFDKVKWLGSTLINACKLLCTKKGVATCSCHRKCQADCHCFLLLKKKTNQEWVNNYLWTRSHIFRRFLLYISIK